MALKLNAIGTLPEVPASDVKKRGWRGVVRRLQAEGPIVITNHEEPEAVVIAARDYEGILEMLLQAEAEEALALEALRRQFDERLAGLNTPDAGRRLRSILHTRARLHGRATAGARD